MKGLADLFHVDESISYFDRLILDNDNGQPSEFKEHIKLIDSFGLFGILRRNNGEFCARFMNYIQDELISRQLKRYR